MLHGTNAAQVLLGKRQFTVAGDISLTTIHLDGIVIVDTTTGPVNVQLPPANTVRAGGKFHILALNAGTTNNNVNVAPAGADTYNDGLTDSIALIQDGSLLTVFATEAATSWIVPLGGLVQPPGTIHFNIGNVGAITLGAPGVANPAAMAFFGQLNIASFRTIVVNHLHLTEDGAAPSVLNIELWRRRSGVMTRLTQLTYTAPAGADFVTVGAVPAGDLAQLQPGDYLFCQAVTGTTLAGGGDGLTVDVHFDA